MHSGPLHLPYQGPGGCPRSLVLGTWFSVPTVIHFLSGWPSTGSSNSGSTRWTCACVCVRACVRVCVCRDGIYPRIKKSPTRCQSISLSARPKTEGVAWPGPGVEVAFFPTLAGRARTRAWGGARKAWIPRYDTIRYGTVRYGTVRRGTPLRDGTCHTYIHTYIVPACSPADQHNSRRR